MRKMFFIFLLIAGGVGAEQKTTVEFVVHEGTFDEMTTLTGLKKDWTENIEDENPYKLAMELVSLSLPALVAYDGKKTDYRKGKFIVIEAKNKGLLCIFGSIDGKTLRVKILDYGKKISDAKL